MIRLFIIAFLMITPALAADQPLQNPSQAATTFAAMAGAKDQFRTFVSRVAMNTVTIRGLIAAHGQDAVLPVLKREIETATAKRDEEWQTNLARAYEVYFTPAELESLVKEKQRSTYFDALKERVPKVGAEMQRLSEPLLQTTTREVLEKTFVQFSPQK